MCIIIIVVVQKETISNAKTEEVVREGNHFVVTAPDYNLKINLEFSKALRDSVRLYCLVVLSLNYKTSKIIKMKYKVVPLEPSFDMKRTTTKDASEYLEKFINHYENQGWRYIRVEIISTFISGDNGCFGFGATPGYTANKQMVVFSKV